jgi:hypothetical protein
VPFRCWVLVCTFFPAAVTFMRQAIPVGMIHIPATTIFVAISTRPGTLIPIARSVAF